MKKMGNWKTVTIRNWYILNLVSIIFYTAEVAYLIYLVSLENLKAIIRAGYQFWFSAAISVFLIVIFLNFLSFYIYKKNRKSSILYILKTITILQLIFILTVPICFTHIYKQLIHGKMPDIPEKYRYRIGPFIQPGPVKNRQVLSTSTSMVIWWFDPEIKNETAHIKFGLSRNKKSMKTGIEELNGDGKKHLVILKDLKPASKYYYYIPGFNENIFSFITGPDVNNPESFSFLCTGDVRNSGSSSISFYGNINRAAEIQYRRTGRHPSFKLVLGDLTYDGRDLESWNYYFNNEIIHSRIYPTVSVFGNHEFHTDYGGNFYYLMEHPGYFSFDYSNAHFLLIHNYDGLLRTTGRDQFRFIENDLKKNYNRKWIIVALHEPLLSTGDYNYNRLLISQFFNLFRKYKVDLVLAGHDHQYDSFWVDRESDWGGTIHIVNGGGGSKLDGYIMKRGHLRWKTWYHDNNSEYGPYSGDNFTKKYHVYGELSWGFMDIEINKNSIKTTYYRWMNIPEYRKLSQQEDEEWEMEPVQKDQVKPVHVLKKLRNF